MKSITKTLVATSLLVASALFSIQAAAMPIIGDLTWSGMYTRTGDVYSFQNVEIDSATGDYAAAGFAHNDALNVADLDIGSFVAGPIWSDHGLTMILNSINVIFDMASPNFSLVSGSATVSGQGFDDTAVSFYFSANPLNFSAAAVPEPSIAMLLLSGLLFVGLRRRRTLGKTLA